MTTLRIGTRGSPLALWQAHAVRAAVERSGGPPCEIVVIKTTGDRLATTALEELGGKHVFVKEIEEALLDERVDIAVHSAKDLPAELPPGLGVAAVLRREDPRDALCQPDGTTRDADASAAALIAAHGPRPTIGTGSIRRTAQLASRFPQARFAHIRGNVGTRLRKLDAGTEYDLLVLAAAGLKRLGLEHRIAAPLSFDECLPAPGQGIVAIETRAADVTTAGALAAINDAATMAAFRAERALVAALGGDCHMPIGAVAVAREEDEISLRALVASPDGTRLLERHARDSVTRAVNLGQEVAQRLFDDGAAAILAEAHPNVP